LEPSSDRRIAAFLGLLGALLIGLEGLVDLVRSAIYLTVGSGVHAFLPFDQGVIFLFLGLLVGVFSFLGGMRGEGRATVAGAVLLVIVVLGWLALGLGSGLLAVLGAVLVLVAGVVFLASGR